MFSLSNKSHTGSLYWTADGTNATDMSLVEGDAQFMQLIQPMVYAAKAGLDNSQAVDFLERLYKGLWGARFKWCSSATFQGHRAMIGGARQAVTFYHPLIGASAVTLNCDVLAATPGGDDQYVPGDPVENALILFQSYGV